MGFEGEVLSLSDLTRKITIDERLIPTLAKFPLRFDQ